ncbi:MAG: hypothetical protein K2M17_05320 [Bacilli bacterium]|nr:hypothetical protein [Bacilli bacterium]
MNQNYVQEFIDKILSIDLYNSSEISANNQIDKDLIYSIIVSSKFRKTMIDDETAKDIKQKLDKCLEAKIPLQFSVPFGAYKAWRLNLNFRPDWAEVFNISYILKYVTSIASVYPYGVEVTYTYSDDLMYFVSDYPRDGARHYVDDFQYLLKIFSGINPSVKISLMKINDLYSSAEEYYVDFLKHFLDNLVFWDSKYNDETKNRHLSSANHNLNLFGERCIGDQTPEVQEKYFYYSALMTDAVDCLKERRKFNKDQDRIQLIGVKGPSKSINLGACETSTVHFWTGRGCLKLNKGNLKPYIYTNSNINKIYESGNFSEFEIDGVFSSISDNFKKILYIKE